MFVVVLHYILSSFYKDDEKSLLHLRLYSPPGLYAPGYSKGSHKEQTYQ